MDHSDFVVVVVVIYLFIYKCILSVSRAPFTFVIC